MNKVILMGRLTADPELKYTSTGNVPVCRFSIAVDRPYVKQGEERQADYFKIVAWRATGEFVSRYFRKGVRILVEGCIRNNSYEDTAGVKHYSDDVHAERVYFADGKKDDLPSGGGFSQPNTTTTQQSFGNQSDPIGFYPMGEEDDLPF